MLLERCDPGTPLLELDDDDAGDVVADLLPRLWKSPPQTLRLASDLALRWIDELPRQWHATGRPFERSLLDAAVDALRELGPTQGPLVLSNEDFHAGNVLRGTREPWLAIDPKPIAAEREFTVLAMIRDRPDEVLAGPRPLPRLRRRLDRLSSDLSLDRERMRDWTVGAHDRVGLRARPLLFPLRLCGDGATLARGVKLYGYGSGGGSSPGGGGGAGGESSDAVSVALIWPRISPAAFFFVWTLTYVRPASIVLSCACVMVAVPRFPLLHGPQSATMTFPALPGLPMWMWAAAAAPVSFENVSFHASLARSFASSTVVAVNAPLAPTRVPVGFGTSELALRVAVSL